MEYLGNIQGILWGILGENLGNTWGILGEYLGNTWGILGEYLGNTKGNAWGILGEYLENSWGNIQEILVLEKIFGSDNFACLGAKVLRFNLVSIGKNLHLEVFRKF